MRPENGQGADREHCRAFVRQHNLDDYLTVLLAPKDKQDALFAVYALAGEVERIAETVSEAQIGEIRLQWWSDSIDSIYVDAKMPNPVLRQLAMAVRQYDLPKHLFTRFLEAHRFGFHNISIADTASLVDHLQNQHASIADLACRILIGPSALELDDIIKAAAVTVGLTRLLTGLSQNAARSTPLIPADLIEKHQLNLADLRAGKSSVGSGLALAQLRHLATENLARVRREQGRIENAAMPAFYPASLCELYLNKMARSSADPLSAAASPSKLARQWYLFKKSTLEAI